LLHFFLTGFRVSKEALDEVATLSEVMSVGDEYLAAAVREECERIIPAIDDVKPSDAPTAYKFLKTHYEEPSAEFDVYVKSTTP
jgi:hypothetical protein